jgi:hypothetical protein
MPKPRNSQAVHDSKAHVDRTSFLRYLGKVIQLIHDGNANGQLGWILVRNLGQKQLQAGNVDSVDIASLKLFLTEISDEDPPQLPVRIAVVNELDFRLAMSTEIPKKGCSINMRLGIMYRLGITGFRH